MYATDPQGRLWTVGRRWIPWRQHFAITTPTSAPEGRDVRIGWPTVTGLVAAAVLPLLWLAEVAALLAVVPFSLALRVGSGASWPVLARCNGTPVWEAPGGDFHGSGRLAQEVCDAIRAGTLPPRTLGR